MWIMVLYYYGSAPSTNILEGPQPTPQVFEGFAGFYRSGASSLQLVEQYFRFLKVLQEFSGSEPTIKGNDLKNERPETKGNTSSWFRIYAIGSLRS